MLRRAPWGDLAVAAPTPKPRVAVLGVPWDGSVCLRPGAAEAPARLRAFSSSSPAVSEDGHVVEASRFAVRDLGDVVPPAGLRLQAPNAEPAVAAYFEEVERAAQATLAGPEAPLLLSIGGDHSVTIPLFRAFAAASDEPAGLVLLDAHPDLFDVYEGSRLSHACPIRRALESGRLADEHVLMLGTRSYNVEELEVLRRRGIRHVPARELARRGVGAVVAEARERLRGVERVYLTLDIDVADPAFAPGTGAPVAGGLTSRELLDLVRGLVESLPVRAMDLVEIAPPLDPTETTLALGLQIVFETLAALDRKQALLPLASDGRSR